MEELLCFVVRARGAVHSFSHPHSLEVSLSAVYHHRVSIFIDSHANVGWRYRIFLSPVANRPLLCELVPWFFGRCGQLVENDRTGCAEGLLLLNGSSVWHHYWAFGELRHSSEMGLSGRGCRVAGIRVVELVLCCAQRDFRTRIHSTTRLDPLWLFDPGYPL